MSEVNQRWERDHREVKKLTGAGIVAASALWAVSYFASTAASWAAAAAFTDAWFGFLAAVTFLGASGVTIGTGIGVGILLTDEPPLPGANG